MAVVQGIYLTPEELQRMHYLRPEPLRLYIKLRMRMDYATGVVGRKGGRKSGLSYALLADLMEVEGEPGVTAYRPTTGALRRMLERLEREGLAQRVPPHDFLVFRLLLAASDQSVLDQAGRGCAGNPAGNPAGSSPYVPTVCGTRPAGNPAGQNAQAGTTPRVVSSEDVEADAGARDVKGVDAVTWMDVANAFMAVGLPQDRVNNPKGRRTCTRIASMGVTPEQLAQVQLEFGQAVQRKRDNGDLMPYPEYAIPICERVLAGKPAPWLDNGGQRESAAEYAQRIAAQQAQRDANEG